MDIGRAATPNDSITSREPTSGPWFGFPAFEIMKESKLLLFLGTPLIVSSLIVFLLQVISIMFVGHLGTVPLAAASMAISFASVTGFSVLRGMAGALDTFCGQSYGVKDFKMVGIHTQSAAMALLLVSIPVAILWANTGAILLRIGLSPAVSNEAEKYSRLMIPAVFGYAIQISLVEFLQCQRIVKPLMLISAATFIGHLVWSFLLVFKTGLGSKGAAIGFVITVWFNTFMLIVYVLTSSSCKQTRTGFSPESINGIPPFMKLAVPSGLMYCLELWSFETTVFLAGLLPNPVLETSALSISFNTCIAMYMIPVGLRSATSTLVSNELGSGNPRAARLAVVTSLFLITIESIILAATVIIGRTFWVKLFSKDLELNSYAAKLLILVATGHILDAIQCILSGSCRGSGRQKSGAVVNLCAYYFIGLPCTVILGFVMHFGGQGLWIGIIVALIFQTIGLSVVTWNTDWEKEAKKAKERNLENNSNIN